MPSITSALHNCATECTLRRKKGRCKLRFGSYACNDCKYYVNKYIDADPRHVELFMIDAEMRAGAVRATSGGHHFVFALLISLCLLFAWTSYSGEQRRDSRSNDFPDNTVVSAITATQSGSAQHEVVMSTLRHVSRDLGRGIDVNRDGLVNCIDAAVLFYQYFPDKDRVAISLNRNPATGMHHLFNVVLMDGVWRAIEPQAVWANNSSFFMRDVWGALYDSSLNRVVTNDYLRYVR
jgi:hypothetical protein